MLGRWWASYTSYSAAADSEAMVSRGSSIAEQHPQTARRQSRNDQVGREVKISGPGQVKSACN